MKKRKFLVWLSAVVCLGLCIRVSFANDELTQALLKLPAPPALNPFIRHSVTTRDDAFYDVFKPPSDDASIGDILDYWVYWANVGNIYTPKPTDKVLERIKNEIRKDHFILLNYINLFQDRDVEFVKEIYDEEVASKKLDRWWRQTVRNWLVYNSDYFTSELFELVQRKLAETTDYVEGKEELMALAKFDWEKAEPIVRQLALDNTRPGLQTLAKWILYKRSIETGDEGEAERLREELKKIAADKSQKSGVRDLALDALFMEKDFPGRDDWYFSLMNDETLLNLKGERTNFTGLMTLIQLSEPGKYKNKMIELLRSDNRVVASAAAYFLLSDERALDEKVVKELLPLLSDPSWIPNGELRQELRRKLVWKLLKIKVPESVPSLILALQEALGNYKQSQSEASVQAIYEIVNALGNQEDSKALPILWETFAKFASDSWRKYDVVVAIFRCGGFSIAEQVDAIEKKLLIEGSSFSDLETEQKRLNPADQIKVLLGRYLLQDSKNFSDELVFAILERVKSLKKLNPSLAKQMRAALINLDVSAINSILLAELGDGSIDVEGVLRLLINRKKIRQKYLEKVYSLRNKNPFADGFSSCLLEKDYDAILEGNSTQAKAALLACARLLRAELPIEKVAMLLKPENKLLFDAAIKYLEAEDSPQARQIIWSLYPGQAKILGAIPYFGDRPPDELFELMGELFETVLPYGRGVLYQGDNHSRIKSLKEEEEKLQKEILEREDLLGIYAYNGNIVRIYKDKATFTWRKNKDFQIERVLQAEELERLKRYIAETQADLLPPFFEDYEDTHGEYFVDELLMLGKAGGRRVFVVCPVIMRFSFWDRLEDIFKDFQKKGGILRYALQDVIPNLEILYYGEKLRIEGVWKKGNDFRVLVKDEEKLKKVERELEEKIDALEQYGEDSEEYGQAIEALEIKQQHITTSYSWRKFENGVLKDLTVEPEGFDTTPYYIIGPFIEPFAEHVEKWKRKNASFLISVDSDLLIKKDLYSGKEEKACFLNATNPYLSLPVLSADGRWVLINVEGRLKKCDLQTNKLSEIPIDDGNFQPIVYIPALSKFLVANVYFGEEGFEIEDFEFGFEYKMLRNFYLVDPVTGKATKVNERVRPLAQQTWRPLQPFMGKADEFWVAEPDLKNRKTVIGIFNVRNFSFRPVMTLPKIAFNSTNMWVDEQERKVYIAHGGNLLRISLP
ncbi:MAG: hypothetical protein D6687_10855 [Acidobacteria bacterium]|jgi:hypothetical protein|nr:MAG: hypothetical protein D6687_10855 [Acidobacteriota bacterium]GIU81393.1 MAG: hypothetical protein KatS3mg006_0457 [Pyrinomonadaceae bacterium]